MMHSSTNGAGVNTPHSLEKISQKPVVTPLSVFAARRDSFDAIVRTTTYAGAVKLAVLNALPLENNGWRFKGMTARHIGKTASGEDIWRIARGAP